MHTLPCLPRQPIPPIVGEVCPLKLPLRPIVRVHHRVTPNSSDRAQTGRCSSKNFVLSASESSPGSVVSFGQVEAVPVREDDGELKPAPQVPGVYAFYDKEGVLQYIGLSRKVSPRLLHYQAKSYTATIFQHKQNLQEESRMRSLSIRLFIRLEVQLLLQVKISTVQISSRTNCSCCKFGTQSKSNALP